MGSHVCQSELPSPNATQSHHLHRCNFSVRRREGRSSGESERARLASSATRFAPPPPPPKTSPTLCKSAKEASRSRRRRLRLPPLGPYRARRRCSSRFQRLPCRSSYGGSGKLHLLQLQLRATVTDCSGARVGATNLFGKPKTNTDFLPFHGDGFKFLNDPVDYPDQVLRSEDNFDSDSNVPVTVTPTSNKLHHRLRQP
ncbi:hypothetical protein BHE74_00006117 [Ensete ventricosum]|nr:hypothetical protein GW17_00011503 [Ensete ventricosum]RWW85236.1 hypothetical protein BHE74_00006117 [Ensete ventricosum]